jgi:hypothetical protein
MNSNLHSVMMMDRIRRKRLDQSVEPMEAKDAARYLPSKLDFSEA